MAVYIRIEWIRFVCWMPYQKMPIWQWKVGLLLGIKRIGGAVKAIIIAAGFILSCRQSWTTNLYWAMREAHRRSAFKGIMTGILELSRRVGTRNYWTAIPSLMRHSSKCSRRWRIYAEQWYLVIKVSIKFGRTNTTVNYDEAVKHGQLTVSMEM